jgi:hypothetical protein
MSEPFRCAPTPKADPRRNRKVRQGNGSRQFLLLGLLAAVAYYYLYYIA